MKKTFLFTVLVLFATLSTQAQVVMPGFGKGLNYYGTDSSFHIRFGFRFQNLYSAEWNVSQGNLDNINSFQDEIMVRRARLKFDGYAFSPKLTYKMELGLSNRDISGGGTNEFSGTDNIIYDASVDWNFYKNLTLRFGQAKLPGNIERVISSANLQLVDRSLLNARFNIDRDMGVQLMNQNYVGKVLLKQIVAVSQGEGRDVTSGSFGGRQLTARAEILPFGEFHKDKDDYVGSALVYYTTPKLMIGATYDHNQNAVRQGGNLGSFIKDSNGNYVGKNLNTLFVDAVFKYQRFSFMGEYAHKTTADGDPLVSEGKTPIGTFVTGEGINLQAGYMLNPKVSTMTGHIEIVGRLTSVDLDTQQDENQYTIGVNRFISGHQLKIQADLTYRDVKGLNANDGLMFRIQTDVHF